jgi:hypothetical protein
MGGYWTHHSDNPQQELIDLLKGAGGSASIEELYRSHGAWGIRIQTVKALIKKNKIVCEGKNMWYDKLTVITD